MGKEKRARKSRRKVLCIPCEKSMTWEFFRNTHIHKKHGGTTVPVRVIATSENASKSDLLSFFQPRNASTTTVGNYLVAQPNCFSIYVENGILM